MSRKCLIIDDSEIDMIVTQRTVESLGFEVVIKPCAIDGMVMTEELDFDVIMVDWHMPEISGIEFIRKMRQTKKGRDIVMFLYSSVEDYRGTREALKSGADGFVYKPSTKDQIHKYFRELALIPSYI